VNHFVPRPIEDARWIAAGTTIECLIRHWPHRQMCGYVVVPEDVDLSDADFSVDITGEFSDKSGDWIGFVGALDATIDTMKATTEGVARAVWQAGAAGRSAQEAKAEAERIARAIEDAKPWPRWYLSIFPDLDGWTLACHVQQGACVGGIRSHRPTSNGLRPGLYWWHVPKKCGYQKASSIAEATEILVSRGLPAPPSDLVAKCLERK